MRYEPMFAELARRGYDWESCNVMGALTQRTRPDGTPAEPLGRIDWFFARGLACSDPAVIPAVDRRERRRHLGPRGARHHDLPEIRYAILPLASQAASSMSAPTAATASPLRRTRSRA